MDIDKALVESMDFYLHKIHIPHTKIHAIELTEYVEEKVKQSRIDTLKEVRDFDSGNNLNIVDPRTHIEMFLEYIDSELKKIKGE